MTQPEPNAVEQTTDDAGAFGIDLSAGVPPRTYGASPEMIKRVAAALAAVYDNNPGSPAVEVDMRAARAAIEAMEKPVASAGPMIEHAARAVARSARQPEDTWRVYEGLVRTVLEAVDPLPNPPEMLDGMRDQVGSRDA